MRPIDADDFMERMECDTDLCAEMEQDGLKALKKYLDLQPIFIADSPKELSAVVGVDSNTISSMICRAKTKGKECRFAKVDISEV